MSRNPFEAIARKALPFSRRWIAGGALGAALAGMTGLLAMEEAGAGKRGKKGKKGKKKKCRKGCKDGEACKKGRCRCPKNAQKLAECLPGEDPQWCTPAPGNPRVCCPENRIYAVCDLEAKTASGECGDPAAQSVCCPETRLCGNRCCEGPFTCVDASTSTCTGSPPVYARLRRPR
jgi:hypothetical protein